MPEAGAWIRVRGARTHNLRNVDADLPHGCLTVITLTYCAWADFLYVCRVHAYVTLKSSVSQPPAEVSVVPMPEAPVTPTPNGHH